MKRKGRIITSIGWLFIAVFCIFWLTACIVDEECSHQWSEWETTINATCIETGLKTSQCSECDSTRTEKIEAFGHQWSEWETTTETTCTNNGLQTSQCSKCGSTRTEEIEALGHQWSSDTEPKTCARCNVTEGNYSELSYVAFGDSITWGYDFGTQMAEPYPTLVANTLGLKSYSNLGVSGATFCSNSYGAFNMTERIITTNYKADIISVFLGTNDFAKVNSLGNKDSKDNTTIYGSLYLICEKFKNEHPNSFIFFMTPYQRKYTNNSVYSLSDVATAIKYRANEYGFPVLDLYSMGKFEEEMNLPTSDGLHPSQSFIKTYTAPQIVNFIKHNYTKK